MSSIQVLPTAQTSAPQTQRSLELNTLAEVMNFADLVSKSELAPKDYIGRPANVVVAIQFGKELGVAPLQALQGIAVINGRPGVWGDLMWALVTTHPQFEDAIEEANEKQATVTLKRRGRTPVTVTFTQADAVRAGLWGKDGPWSKYPKRQMLWRARTFAARDLFPDALKGLVSVEEIMDYNGPTIDANNPLPDRSEELQKRTAPAVATPVEEPSIDPSMDDQSAQEPSFGESPESSAPWKADSQPASAPSTSACITEQQGKKFWAVAMGTHGDHRKIMDYLRDTLRVSNKALIPVDRWADALAWAEGR